MKLLKLVMRAVFLILGNENCKQESEVTFHLLCLVCMWLLFHVMQASSLHYDAFLFCFLANVVFKFMAYMSLYFICSVFTYNVQCLYRSQFVLSDCCQFTNAYSCASLTHFKLNCTAGC